MAELAVMVEVEGAVAVAMTAIMALVPLEALD